MPPTLRTPPGCFRCSARRCSVCPFINQSHKFTSSVTKESFPITTHLHCKSDWLIYLITCTTRNKQYVGKTTTTLYTRFTNTKSYIKKYNTDRRKSLPIAQHFRQPHHTIQNISLSAIEKIHCKRDDVILHRKSYWIVKLKTLSPSGINADE